MLPQSVQARAVADGDDFVLNGGKLFVDNFSVADQCLVVCRTADASGANEGLSLFLVDCDSPGISHQDLVTLAKDKQSEVTFRDVRISGERLIGGLNEGAPIAENLIELATALLCAKRAWKP